MLQELFNLVKGSAGESVINNPDVPNQQNNEVVAEATNGEEAVTAARMTNPDLVFLDVNLPLMTGPEALSAIIAAKPGVAVIMLSSVSDAETVQDCLPKGAVNFIRKDANATEISAMIRQTLSAIFGKA